jgi:tetratricopeptide (TPR) repeat protein
VNSSLKNYFYLNPTKEFIKFQSDNIETPLYFFNNNHLAPAGHRLAAIIAYNFLAKNNLLSFQDTWEMIDPFDSQTKRLVSQANDRIRRDMETDIRFYKYKGLFYNAKGKDRLAKENLSQYLENKKKDFEAYYLLGSVLFRMNQFVSAIKNFEKSFDGQYIEMYKYKYAYNFTKIYKEGWEHYRNGKLNKALSFAKRLEKLKGDWWSQSVFFNFLIYYKMKDYKNAERFIEQGLRYWPKNLRFILNMASLKFEQKQYEKAIKYAFQGLMLSHYCPGKVI